MLTLSEYVSSKHKEYLTNTRNAISSCNAIIPFLNNNPLDDKNGRKYINNHKYLKVLSYKYIHQLLISLSYFDKVFVKNKFKTVYSTTYLTNVYLSNNLDILTYLDNTKVYCSCTIKDYDYDVHLDYYNHIRKFLYSDNYIETLEKFLLKRKQYENYFSYVFCVIKFIYETKYNQKVIYVSYTMLDDDIIITIMLFKTFINRINYRYKMAELSCCVHNFG